MVTSAGTMWFTVLCLLQLASASDSACDLDGVCLLQTASTTQTAKVDAPKCKSWCTAETCGETKKCGACPQCVLEGPPWESLENIEMSTQEVKGKMLQKYVVMANEKVPEEAMELFTDLASSFWQFGLVPGPGAAAWAQKHDKDFIALIDLKEPVPKKYGKCQFHDNTGLPKCTADKIVKVLEDSKKQVKMQYLMGFNEPFGGVGESASHGKKALKHADPEVAAEWWRTIVQPAAERTGLELVSPTFGAGSGKGDWGVKFLQACYDNRNAAPPCNVELIKAISVHHMVCYAGFWRKSFAPSGGDDVEMCDQNCQRCSEQPKFPKTQDNFYTFFKERMREKYGSAEMESFWDPYFDSVKIWVVPNSCGNDANYNRKTKGDVPTAADYCEAMTGQSCIHQEGSIKAFLDMDNVDKFSWYVTWIDTLGEKAPNREAQMASRMFDTDIGEPTPVGRAILGGLNAEQADCRGA